MLLDEEGEPVIVLGSGERVLLHVAAAVWRLLDAGHVVMVWHNGVVIEPDPGGFMAEWLDTSPSEVAAFLADAAAQRAVLH